MLHAGISHVHAEHETRDDTETQQRSGRPGPWPRGVFNLAGERQDRIYSCHTLTDIMKPPMSINIFSSAENVIVEAIQSKSII